MTRARISCRCAAVALLAVCLLLGAGSVVVAEDCESSVAAELVGEEPNGAITHLQFSVDVSSGESCAKIFYDLVIEIQLGNQQTKRVRIPREVRLSDGSASEIVEHVLGEGSSMIDYEARIVRCELCEMGVD